MPSAEIANNCFYKLGSAFFHLFTESDNDLLKRTLERTVGGPSIVLRRNFTVDKNLVPNSKNTCKAFVGFEACQLCLYSMCQALASGLHSRWDLDSETGRLKACQNKTRSLENSVLLYFQKIRPQDKMGSLYMTSTEKKVMPIALALFVLAVTMFLTL